MPGPEHGAGSLSTGQWSANCDLFGACRDCAQTIEYTGPTAAAWRAAGAPPVTACASALTMPPGGGTVGGLTSGADTLDPPNGCAYLDNSTAPEKVYAWTPATSGAWTVATCGSSVDTVLYVRSGDCVGGPTVACNDDACGLQSQVTVEATAGTTYYIVVDGYASARGLYPHGVAGPRHAHANGDPNSDRRPDPDRDADVYRHAHVDADTDADRHAHGHAHADPHAAPDADTQVFRFEAAQDAWIDQGKPTQNKGTDTSLRVKAQGGSLRRSLVQFDLSGIPASGCIQTAMLKMTLTSVGRSSRSYGVYRVSTTSTPWVEGTSSSSSGVTWQRRTGSAAWTSRAATLPRIPRPRQRRARQPGPSCSGM